ncbi:MAG TPA: lysophospholipid acyltransferase family protein [Burkholderiales bacterium]|nr:lysophospholipid acyltransferase family protein [Burkholderiales bacterium]
MAPWLTLRRPYEYLVLYGGLLLFGLPILLWSLCAAVLYAILPRKVSAPMGQHVLKVLFNAYLAVLKASGLVKFDLDALDALREERSLIIAPNHPSLIDVVLVVSRLPHVVCIMKSEIRDNMIFGGSARLADYIHNNSALGMIRSAADAVRAGNQLLVFPEGTRTRQGPVNEFKGGFALIAKSAGAPVQTVFIESNSPFLGKGWPLLKKPVFPLIYRARLGERFEVRGDVKTFVSDLECYYRETLGPRNIAG